MPYIGGVLIGAAPIIIRNYMVIQFACLFVCLFTIQAKTIAQSTTKLSGIIKWGSRSILHGLKLPVLQFLKSYPSIFSFHSRLTAILLIVTH